MDIETDKVMLEVPAPVDGVLKKYCNNEGETVYKPMQVIGIIEAGKRAANSSKPSKTKQLPEQLQLNLQTQREAETTSAKAERPAADPNPAQCAYQSAEK